MNREEKRMLGIMRSAVILAALFSAMMLMPLGAQGDLPPANDEQPEISREALAEIDEELGVLLDLRDQWIVQRFPVEVADEMRDRIKNFPPCFEIHQKFMESLKSELDRGKVELVPKREGYSLPPRNVCSDIPGHVTCFKTHNGLIHGGVINMPNDTTLVCRAFRLVDMYRYHGTHSYKRDEMREAVVAGVCEKKNSAGQVLERWSTADYLPLKHVSKSYYSSTSVGLPAPAVQRTYFKKDGRRWAAKWFGYYFPSGWDGVIGYDNGNPSYEHWPSLGGAYIWIQPPPYNTAVESPTYDYQESCTPGYVICSSYLKVFHPNPNMKKAIVALIGAYRLHEQRMTIIVAQGRHAKWYTRTFSVED